LFGLVVLSVKSSFVCRRRALARLQIRCFLLQMRLVRGLAQGLMCLVVTLSCGSGEDGLQHGSGGSGLDQRSGGASGSGGAGGGDLGSGGSAAESADGSSGG